MRGRTRGSLRLSRRVVATLVPLLATIALETRAQAPGPVEAAGWRMAYRNDAQGRPVAGDKAALLDAIRRGYDVRLAWGVQHPRDSTRSVEHTALPVFVTIVDGSEVFVQVAEHLAHHDYWGRERQDFADPSVVWAGILGTTGSFSAVWYNRATGEKVRDLPQRVAMTWFVDFPPERSAYVAAPPLHRAG